MANRPSRIVIPVRARSYDSLYHGRYPNGDAPQLLAAAVAASVGVGASLTAPGGGGGGSNLVMYSNGVIDRTRWPAGNDYSFGATPAVNLANTSNPNTARGHTQSLAILGQFSGWQQATDWATGPTFGLDISGYIGMKFDCWLPTGCTLQMLAHYTRSAGDDISTSTYLPDIQASVGSLSQNAWNADKFVRFSHLGMLGSESYYKFLVQQNTAASALLDQWEFVVGTTVFIYNKNAMQGAWSTSAVNGSVVTNFSPNAVGANLFPLNQPSVGQLTSAVQCIKLTGTSVNPVLKFSCGGGGQPLAGLARFTIGLLPTKAGYAYSIQCLNTSGVPVGTAVNPSAFTPVDFGVNTADWTVYDMPLSAFGSIGSTIGGIQITETSSNTTNVVYATAPAFTS